MMTEWKSKLLVPSDGPVFSNLEYDFLITEEYVNVVKESIPRCAPQGFMQEVDILLEKLSDDLKEKAYENAEDNEVLKLLIAKLAPYKGKWIFLE